jgi:general secretion pathway protein D
MILASRARYLPVLIAAAIGLAACQGPSPAPTLTPLEAPSALQAAAPRVNSVIPGDRHRTPVFESPGARPAPPLPPPRQVGSPDGAGDVTLNFVDTDIREIVRVMLGETLKVNYTIDPAVQGTASLEISTPVPRPALLAALETLLNQNGATLIVKDGLYRVAPLAGSIAAASPTSPDTVGSSMQVVPLRYASAKDLAKLLEPYVTDGGGKVSADPGRNALIVAGTQPVRQTLLELIRIFDVDALAGQSFALFPAGDNPVEQLAEELEKILRTRGEDSLSGVVRIVPLQRVKAILVATAQPRYLAEARRFFELKRRVEDSTKRAWHVYYVQNGQSTDLENLLQRAFTPGRVSPTPEPLGTTAPGAEPVQVTGGLTARSTGSGLGQSSGAQAGGVQGGLSTAARITSATPTGAATQEGASSAGHSLSPQTAPGEADAENRIRIIANRRNNALMIYATQSEYAVVEGMLRKIDIIPLQVLIEATIAEVTLNDQLNYGTQFYLGNRITGILTTAGPSAGTVATDSLNTTIAPTTVKVGGTPIGIGSNFPGFVVANGIREVINALSAVTQVKVLSSPQVVVLDNESARLQVGAQVPVLTQTQQSTLSTGAPIVNSVEYRDTGVIMLVTPRVNSGGLVTLDISQEVSDVATTSTGNISSPTFNQRLIRTRVAVQDGQTVGMAGLIRDIDSQQNAGIPVLKDIPVLGSLFSSQQNSRTRTELLVLITPRVIHDQRDARALTEDLRHQLINAGMVRQDLRRKAPFGSPNPNRF